MTTYHSLQHCLQTLRELGYGGIKVYVPKRKNIDLKALKTLKASGMTQQEIAFEFSIHQSTVSRKLR